MKNNSKYKIESNHKTVISVITPFYNANTLMETAISLLNQTYPFFEWIIVNDGSTKYLDVLEDVSKLDNRIKVFNKKNEGPAVARDYGASKSLEESKYLFFLDSDDLIDNNALEYMYYAIETTNSSLCTCIAQNFGDDNNIWDNFISTAMEKEENMLPISNLINKKDFYEVGSFGIKEKKVYEDWNLWLKLLANNKKIVKVNYPLFKYRVNSTGEFSSAQSNHLNAMKYINKTNKKIKINNEVLQFPKNNYQKYDCNLLLPKSIFDDKNIIFVNYLNDIKNYEVRDNSILISLMPNKSIDSYVTNNYEYIYDLAAFLDRENYPLFINNIISNNNINKVININSDYAYYLLSGLNINLKNKNDKQYENISYLDYVKNDSNNYLKIIKKYYKDKFSIDIIEEYNKFNKKIYFYNLKEKTRNICDKYNLKYQRLIIIKFLDKFVYTFTHFRKFIPNLFKTIILFFKSIYSLIVIFYKIIRR